MECHIIIYSNETEATYVYRQQICSLCEYIAHWARNNDKMGKLQDKGKLGKFHV